MSSTSYSRPEAGQVGATTVDPAGIALTNAHTYETSGAGFARETDTALAGANIAAAAERTHTDYWGSTETPTAVANPCGSSGIVQGGRARKTTDVDPDPTGTGAGRDPRTHESVYDKAGKPLGSRWNGDAWTCTTYDGRERPTQTVTPTIASRPGPHHHLQLRGRWRPPRHLDDRSCGHDHGDCRPPGPAS